MGSEEKVLNVRALMIRLGFLALPGKKKLKYRGCKHEIEVPAPKRQPYHRTHSTLKGNPIIEP